MKDEMKLFEDPRLLWMNRSEFTEAYLTPRHTFLSQFVFVLTLSTIICRVVCLLGIHQFTKSDVKKHSSVRFDPALEWPMLDVHVYPPADFHLAQLPFYMPS